MKGLRLGRFGGFQCGVLEGRQAVQLFPGFHLGKGRKETVFAAELLPVDDFTQFISFHDGKGLAIQVRCLFGPGDEFV